MKIATVCSLLLTLSFPLSASATDVYKWIDDNGVPSYGERPPEGVEYIKVKLYGVSSGTRAGTPYSKSAAASNQLATENETPTRQSSVPKNTRP